MRRPQKSESLPQVKFTRDPKSDLPKVLRKRVNEYFESNQLSKHADAGMVWKTVFMTLLYFVPYALVVSGAVMNPWLFYVTWLVMGCGLAGIGLSVMHDANHGAYSANKKINTILGYYLNLVGGNAVNWQIQHNKLHHSYTNVHDMDEDICATTILRFSPHAERKSFHKWQHIYGWVLYGLMTFLWITRKEFAQLKRFKTYGLIKTDKEYNKLFRELVLWKVFYYAYMVAIPLMVISQPIWLILVSFFSMHFVAGLILGLIFQPAHVMPTSDYPLPDETGNIEHDWTVHQVVTTCNFSPDNRLFSWYVGGLNYQIEHHLFPTVCHIHYRNLSKIVRETVQEYGLPYHSKKTFWEALKEHGRMLYRLGRHDDWEVEVDRKAMA